MTELLVISVAFVVLFLIAGVYSSVFTAEQIDEEEAHNIDRRHGRASRAYLEDFSTRKKSPAYYGPTK